MGRLIDADILYKAMQDAEELARRRVRDTESTLPYPTNINPAYTRYLAQMNERTKAKKMVADAQTVDAVPVVRCKDCKHRPTGTNRDDLEFPDDKCPCQCEDFWYSWKPLDNWFCGNGERKDGDHHEG